MNNYIKFYDSVKIYPVSEPKIIKDYIDDSPLPIKPLYTKIAATHSGKVTKNNGFYFPHKMRDGASSFVFPYKKPILLHHEEDQDPIGRIVGSQYVDISGALRDKIVNEKYRSIDLQHFLNGSLNIQESIKFASRYINDNTINADPNFEGLGYIVILAKITDKDAVTKILDGRYETGSVGVSTNRAVCSICKSDWVKDGGPCEHRPGKMYDNEKCFLFTGDLEYSEWSFVNKPADVHSKIIETNINGIQDFIHENDSIHNPEASFFLIDNKLMEDTMLLSQTVIDNLKTNTFFKDKENLEQVVESVLLNDSYTKEDKENKIEELVAKELNILDAYLGLNNDSQAEPETKDLVQEFFGAEYDELVGEDEHGRDYVEMLFSLYSDAENDEAKEEAKKLINDAKLTAAQRKALPDSTFCGPDRSFPVNNCCFTGQTKIDLLDGRSVNIRDIPEMIENGENIWVYSFDIQQKAIVPAKVEKAWKALENAQLLKITLDNGLEIFCTENHPFLTRNMKYKRADELKENESLMPLYKNMTKIVNSYKGYEQIYQPWYGIWEKTHSMVAREFFNKIKNLDEVVHHKNNDNKNNSPENLEIISRSDHCAKHKSCNNGRNYKLNNLTRKIKSIIMQKKMNEILSNEELLEKHKKNISKGRRICDWDNPNNKIKNTNFSLIDIANLVKNGVSKKFIAKYLKVNSATITKWLDKADLNCNIDFNKTETYFNTLEAFFKNEFKYDLKDIYSDYCNGLNYLQLSTKYKIDRFTLCSWFKKLGLESNQVKAILNNKYGNFLNIRNQWLSGDISLKNISCSTNINTERLSKHFKESLKEYPFNHKVLKVEKAHCEDVYDIEVPGTNNFALTAGVFVHNSHYTAALRLLGKYKGPGDKSAIKACIERKGKRMGCTSNSDSVKDSVQPKFTVECFDGYSDQEIQEMFSVINSVLKERNLSHQADNKDNQELNSLNAKVQELQDKLDSSRKENKYLHADLDNITFELSNKTSALKDSYKKYILDVNQLTNNQSNTEEFTLSLNDKSNDELISIVESFNNKMDSKTPGIVNEPTKTVEDPTLVVDNVNATELKQDEATKNRLRLDWLKIRTLQGQAAADKWLDNINKTLGFDYKSTQE